MNILHLSAECYPAAKVGGLADVVGALPQYLCKQDVQASVVIPKYSTGWIERQTLECVTSGIIPIRQEKITYTIFKLDEAELGFPLYLIDLPAYFARDGIYIDPKSGEGYADEAERFIAFQRAVLQWLKTLPHQPDVVHCHDHHTALVPFMMNHCPVFEELAKIPTILTVHNAEYQGWHGPEIKSLLPQFPPGQTGLLKWNDSFNSLAAGLKCCNFISTVSPGYMRELRQYSKGLEVLFRKRKNESQGVLNGIDQRHWNPETDSLLVENYTVESLQKGKAVNKRKLCAQFGFDPARPLVCFIGRLVREKGADLLPDLFKEFIHDQCDISFLVLGTGYPELQERFRKMRDEHVGFFEASINYNEALAHQMYAGADFLIMPSRVEPCGLNQMYAMRYGTIPIVHSVGGLKDTVNDISQANGCGITFLPFTKEAAVGALNRALALFDDGAFFGLRESVMKKDFSWNVSANKYIEIYKQLKQKEA